MSGLGEDSWLLLYNGECVRRLKIDSCRWRTAAIENDHSKEEWVACRKAMVMEGGRAYVKCGMKVIYCSSRVQ
jgi:hypothetical protein